MSIKSTYRVLITLFVLIALHLTILIVWHNSNERPQGRDTAYHLNRTSNLLRLVNNEYRHYYHQQNHDLIYHMLFLSYEHPPLYYHLGTLLYQLLFPLFGFKAIYALSGFFFILTIILCYKIGYIYFDKNTALFAAFLCSFTPLNIATSRQYNLEIATSALTLLIFYFFLKSRYFNNTKYLILTALAAAIAMLIKYTSFLFLFSYISWFLFEQFTADPKSGVKKSIKKISLFLIFFLPLCSLYYANNTVLKSLFTRAVDPSLFFKELPHRFYFYLSGLISSELGLILGLFFISSIWFALKSKNSAIKKLLFFCIGMPLFITILFPKRIGEQLEFAMPILPFIALSISYFIFSIKRKHIRRFLICFLVIFIPQHIIFISFLPKTNALYNYKYLRSGGFPPIKSSAYKNLFDDLLKENLKKELSIGLLAEEGGLFPTNFETYAHLSKLKWEVISQETYQEEFKEKLSNFDYIVYTKKKSDAKNEDIDLFLKTSGFLTLEGTYNFHSTGLYQFSETIFLLKNKAKTIVNRIP